MENVPKETETIAHKRNMRIAEKIKAARQGLSFKKAWWSNRLVEFIGLFLVFAINLLLVFPFFGKPASSMSFSGPIVPLMARGISLFNIPFAYSIQIVNILFFLMFPITFYFFVKTVSGRKFSAFLAVLMITLPFFLFTRTRVDFQIVGTESAYLASLAILPLALMALLKFLKIGGIGNLTVASLVAALTALTSPFGFFIYLIMSFITTFSEFLLGTGRLKLLRLISVYLFAGSLCSFWYNPVFFFWMVTGPMGADFRNMISKLIPISLFVLPVLGSFGYLIFDRKPDLQPVFLAIFYSIVFAVIVFVRSGFVISNSGRYIPILGASLAFLFGVLTVKILENLAGHSKKLFYEYGLKNMILIAISALLVISTYSYKWLVSFENTNVLGIWTDVEKGSIWAMSDSFGNKFAFVGYLITLSGICFLAFLYINYKKAKKTAATN